ncbi:hypothetical protein N7528_000037 [Penicillium herquei]|nr:hypothetical protein N7528_000037 [Penicillium herquei]
MSYNINNALSISCQASREYPPGSLPAEQVLLTKWNGNSSESPCEQRSRLIREHMNSDLIPQSYPKLQDCPQPLPKDIDTVITPWRSYMIRQSAVRTYALRTPLLIRTYYNPDHDAKAADDLLIEEWLQRYKEEYDSMDSLWTYMDDPELLNFGDHWEKIFELVPELTYRSFSRDKTLRPKMPPCGFEKSDLLDTLRSFKEDLHARKDKNHEEWHKNPHRMIYRAAADLHLKCAASLLIIVDREAFRTRHAHIIFIDSRRNVVRETRLLICRKPFLEIIQDWLDRCVTDWLWENLLVGDKYRVDGEFGQDIYEMTAEDWKDPIEI